MKERPMNERVAAELSYEDFRREHAELAETISSIQRDLSNSRSTKNDVGDRTGQLVEKMLEAHFAHEEAGGYMADVVSRAPHLQPTVRRLELQHPMLLEKATKLNMLARSGVESPPWWRELRNEFDSLRQELLDHERQENMLVQEAFTIDIGTKD